MTSPTVTQPAYLTVAEVATTLRLSRMTIYRMCDRGDFPHAIRTGVNGRSIRIPETDLSAHLTPATTAAPVITGQIEITA